MKVKRHFLMSFCKLFKCPTKKKLDFRGEKKVSKEKKVYRERKKINRKKGMRRV